MRLLLAVLAVFSAAAGMTFVASQKRSGPPAPPSQAAPPILPVAQPRTGVIPSINAILPTRQITPGSFKTSNVLFTLLCVQSETRFASDKSNLSNTVLLTKQAAFPFGPAAHDALLPCWAAMSPPSPNCLSQLPCMVFMTARGGVYFQINGSAYELGDSGTLSASLQPPFVGCTEPAAYVRITPQ